MKLIIPKNNEPAAQPDPYIIKEDGYYYIYATGENGVPVYRSRELRYDWEYVGTALEVKGQHMFWAPCVIRLDGKYYMYYSSVPKESEDPHDGCVKVAISARPDGGFEYIKDVYKPFSIDAQVVKNPAGLFMFYSYNDYGAERAGTLIAVDRMIDPFTPAGKPKPVITPSLDEEIFMKDRFKTGQHWHTIEGASYAREGDTHYLLYSGNCYENPDYFIGCAVAQGGDDLTELNFTKCPDNNTYAPLLKRNGGEEGTGHNSIICEDGKIYVVYHARDIGNRRSYDTRTARLAEFIANGQKPEIKRIV